MHISRSDDLETNELAEFVLCLIVLAHVFFSKALCHLCVCVHIENDVLLHRPFRKDTLATAEKVEAQVRISGSALGFAFCWSLECLPSILVHSHFR